MQATAIGQDYFDATSALHKRATAGQRVQPFQQPQGASFRKLGGAVRVAHGRSEAGFSCSVLSTIEASVARLGAEWGVQ